MKKIIVIKLIVIVLLVGLYFLNKEYEWIHFGDEENTSSNLEEIEETSNYNAEYDSPVYEKQVLEMEFLGDGCDMYDPSRMIELQFNIEDIDATEINNLISNDFESTKSTYETLDNTRYYFDTNYIYSENDNITSLEVNYIDYFPCSGYYNYTYFVYNIDNTTGDIIDNDTLINLFDYTYLSLTNAVKEYVEDYLEERYVTNEGPITSEVRDNINAIINSIELLDADSKIYVNEENMLEIYYSFNNWPYGIDSHIDITARIEN